VARESNVDDAIDALCTKRGAIGRKIHGSKFQKVVTDWLICYKGYFLAIESKAGTDLSPQQLRYMRQVRAEGGIAEVAYSAAIVARIFDTIDRGEKWKNGPLEKTTNTTDE